MKTDAYKWLNNCSNETKRDVVAVTVPGNVDAPCCLVCFSTIYIVVGTEYPPGSIAVALSNTTYAVIVYYQNAHAVGTMLNNREMLRRLG